MIAYNNGRIITLSKAQSLNPDRVIEDENPVIYYIDFGTFSKSDEIPNSLTNGNLDLKDYNVKSRVRFNGNQFFSKKYNSIDKVKEDLSILSSDYSKLKIIKTTRNDFGFNYEYKVKIGSFEIVNDDIIKKFQNLKNLEIKDYDVNGITTYFTKSRDDYESVTSDLNLCKSQGLSNSEIIVFKDGVKTELEKIIKNFK